MDDLNGFYGLIKKHFLLFDYVMEITLENYFPCLVLDVKNLFSENLSPSQPPPPRTSTTHHHPHKIQIGKRKKTATTTPLPPPPTQNPPTHPHPRHTKTTKHHHHNNKIRDQTKRKSNTKISWGGWFGLERKSEMRERRPLWSGVA